jgi:hypothetical protein
LIIFGLQLKTDEQMKGIVNQIKTYTEIRKNTDTLEGITILEILKGT